MAFNDSDYLFQEPFDVDHKVNIQFELFIKVPIS